LIISFRVCRAITVGLGMYGKVDNDMSKGTRPERILCESVTAVFFMDVIFLQTVTRIFSKNNAFCLKNHSSFVCVLFVCRSTDE